MTVEQLPVWLSRSLATLIYGMVLVPIAAAALLFCRVASRTGCARKWPLVACALLAVIGGVAFFDVALPGTNQRGLLHDTRFSPEVLAQNTKHGAVTMGFGLGVTRYPRWWQVVQFSVPLAIGAAFIRHHFSAVRRYAT